MGKREVREDREQDMNTRIAVAQTVAQDEKPMRRKTGLHLYVMQAANGRIKIGRSSDPKARMRALETASGQPLMLLKVFKNRGCEERAIHSKLAKWREFGEWFSNSGPSRMAIGDALGGKIGFQVFEDIPLAQFLAKSESRQEMELAVRDLVAEIKAKPPRRRVA